MAKKVTTIRLDEEILKKLKINAINQGKTQSEFIRERIEGDPLVIEKLNQILEEVKNVN